MQKMAESMYSFIVAEQINEPTQCAVSIETTDFDHRFDVGPILGSIEKGFKDAISRYVRGSFEVACELYDGFGSGMALDYERKFDYLGR